MRIAINTRFLLASKMEGFGWYTFEVVKRLAEQHPEHEFLFFFDRAYDPKFIFADNVTPVVLNPQARHPVLFYAWFEWSVRRALKKYKADLFFSPDGYLSLGSPVPQIGVIHDLNFEHYPEDIPWQPRWYLRHFFPKFAKKAHHIVTVSQYSKQDISNTYGIPEQNITVGWNGASEAFKPLSTEKTEEVHRNVSNGRAYFIFVGALHPRKNVPRLLEAFNLFAQMNEAIDLLIVGENLWKNKQLEIPDIGAAAQSRIHFTGHVSLEQLTELMGAAYALVYVPYFEGFGIPIAEALKCGVPVISGNRTSLPEVAGDAALYCDPFSVEDICGNMTELATNDALYQSLKEKALVRGKLFSWDTTAAICMEAIEKVYRETTK